MPRVMIKQRGGRIQSAPLVGPYGCALARAVGAYVCPKAAVALPYRRSVAHVLVDGLPRAVARPVRPMLPHIHPARLSKHPLP